MKSLHLNCGALRSFAAGSLSAALLSACGSVSGVISATPVSVAPAIGAHQFSASVASPGHGRNLYVANATANYTGSVTVYAQGRLRRTISQGLWSPVDLAVDGAGDLYVANAGCQSTDCHPNQNPSTVIVYAPGSEKVRRTITAGLNEPDALALDGSGNVYAANGGSGTVTVYAPGSKNVLRTISQVHPAALAFDRRGNLYVANQGNNGFNTITVYAPGKTTVMRTISQGIFFPVALAFDASQNLYVVNCGMCYGFTSTNGDSVTVYARDSKMLLRTLSDVNYPYALAFDDSDELYVANFGCPRTRCKKYHAYAHSTITVYRPGSETSFRTIRQGLKYPTKLAFNGLGDLYVINQGYNNVTVYAPGSGTVLRTISQGMNLPIALAFGP